MIKLKQALVTASSNVPPTSTDFLASYVGNFIYHDSEKTEWSAGGY